MPRFAPTSLATEEDLREMVETLGDYLDQWCERFLSRNLSSSSRQWSFVTGYNFLELTKALEQEPRNVVEAQALRGETLGSLGQVLLCLVMLAHTLNVKLSDLLLQGGLDFLRFQEERYGTSWYHQLKRLLQERSKSIGTKGNHDKVLT